MLSKTEICNNALLNIGHNELLTNVDSDNTLAAKICNQIWKSCLLSTLESSEWTFASRTVRLNLLVDGDLYQYTLPSDCLVPRRLVKGKEHLTMSTESFPFELVQSEDGKHQVIRTSMPDAYLVYTSSSASLHLFDMTFTNALAWKLAGRLALSLAKNPDQSQKCAQSYSAIISQSSATNANSEESRLNNAFAFHNDHIRSRLS